MDFSDGEQKLELLAIRFGTPESALTLPYSSGWFTSVCSAFRAFAVRAVTDQKSSQIFFGFANDLQEWFPKQQGASTIQFKPCALPVGVAGRQARPRLSMAGS